MKLFDIKDFLLLLIYTLFICPLVVSAADYQADYGTLKVRQVNEQWYEEGVLKQRSSNNIVSFKVSDISFYGDTYSQSTLRTWPYTRVQYLFDKPTFNTSQLYDFDVIAFTDFSMDKQISMRFNGSYNCTPVNQVNKVSWFRCSNVKLISNDTNYILVTFSNNNVVTGGWSFGLSELRLYESGISTSTDILNYMKLFEKELQNGNQQIIDNQDKNNQEQIENANKNHQEQIENENKNHQQTIDTITNDDVSGASASGSGFFENFKTNDHGLSGIVTAPLRIVNGLASTKKCYPVPITMMNKTVYLPCSSYVTNMKGFDYFYYIYNLIVGGFICYFCCRDIFKTTEKLKNPDDDRVEVMDL